MDENANWYGSRPWPRPHCVRRRPSSPRERGTAAPLFSAHVYCGHGRPFQLLLSSVLHNSPFYQILQNCMFCRTSFKFALSRAGISTSSNTWFLDPLQSAAQTASGSVQPLLHSLRQFAAPSPSNLPLPMGDLDPI